MRSPRRVCRLWLFRMAAAAATAPFVVACSSQPEVAISGTETHALENPSFRAFSLEPAKASVPASMLMRDAGSIARYAILTGDRSPAIVEQRVDVAAPRDEKPTTLVVHERRRRGSPSATNTAPWQDSERLSLRRESDGSLTLLEVATPEEDSRSLFVEGLRFAAPLLRPNETVVGNSPMRVVRLKSGSARGDGTASRTLQLVGEAMVEVCGERLRASVLDLVFDVQLDVAIAHVEARIYAVEGRGIVAEERVEKVTILGIFPRTRRETVVLLSEDHAP